MKNIIRKNALAFGLATSLAVSGCSGLKNDEEVDEETIVEEVEEEKYSVKELFIANVPDKYGNVEYKICKEFKDSLYELFPCFVSVLNNYDCYVFANRKNALDCVGEYYLPDYRYTTITPFMENPYVSKYYDENYFLTKENISWLEDRLNNDFIVYNKREKYDINKLFMVEANDFYSIYATDDILLYETHDKNPIIYYRDICDYRNGLQITLNTSWDDFDGNINVGENVSSMEITSLDKDYADAFVDVEKDIIIGDYWETFKYGDGIARINRFSNYLTEEQEERGYLTKDEIFEIIYNLNKRYAFKLVLEENQIEESK